MQAPPSCGHTALRIATRLPPANARRSAAAAAVYATAAAALTTSITAALTSAAPNDTASHHGLRTAAGAMTAPLHLKTGLSLGVLVRTVKENERRQPIHPLHLQRIAPGVAGAGPISDIGAAGPG